MKRFIVIGASAASISFMTKLRTFDKTSEIICFSGEKHEPYNRCFLADILGKEKTVADIQLKPDDFYAKNNIDLRLNSWVKFVDYDMKMVAVGREMFEYDHLFLGVGSHAVHLPFYDEKISGLFNFHTLEDVEKISRFIESGSVKRAIVVGAGLNGLECSFALFELGIKATVVDCADRPLSHQVDVATSEYILSLMDSQVDFVANCFVEEVIVENSVISGVRCKGGAIMEADMVICAAGARVQSSLIKNSPLELHNDSVIVNSRLETSLPEVLAAGDVVFADELVGEGKNKSMTWSDAMLQGLCAATQFSEKPRAYRGLIGMRDSEFFDRTFYACGETVSVEKYQVVEQQGEDFFHRLYLEDGFVKGFVMLGNVDQLPLFRQHLLMQKKYR